MLKMVQPRLTFGPPPNHIKKLKFSTGDQAELTTIAPD